LGIQEPSFSAILEIEPGYAVVMAWTLYAATQPGLSNPTGYVIRQLLDRETPPSEFDDLAQLPLETITLFRRAVRYAGPYREAIPVELERPFRRWERRFPKKRIPLDGASRRGGDWDPPPSRSVDGLEGLLGSIEVDPLDAWAAVCDNLENQVSDSDLAVLRRCEARDGGVGLIPTITLWLPDDAAAEDIVSAHLDSARTALAQMGIRHRLNVEVPLDPVSFLGEGA